MVSEYLTIVQDKKSNGPNRLPTPHPQYWLMDNQVAPPPRRRSRISQDKQTSRLGQLNPLPRGIDQSGGHSHSDQRAGNSYSARLVPSPPAREF